MRFHRNHVQKSRVLTIRLGVRDLSDFPDQRLMSAAKIKGPGSDLNRSRVSMSFKDKRTGLVSAIESSHDVLRSSKSGESTNGSFRFFNLRVELIVRGKEDPIRSNNLTG